MKGFHFKDCHILQKEVTLQLVYFQYCGYTTPENSRLKNHVMSVHQGVMPYACDQCDYKTNEKSDIVRHKHKHLGIKRYQCQFCNYRADQRWLLVSHCAKQHGVQLPRVS